MALFKNPTNLPLHSWLLVNLFGIALAFLAYSDGLLQQIIADDNTYFVRIIGTVFVIGIAISGYHIVRFNKSLKLARQGIFDSTFRNPTALKIKMSSDISILRYLATALVLLGLLGTVVGFKISLGEINVEALTNISLLPGMMTALLGGMHLMMYSTAAGIVANLWLTAGTFIIAKTQSEILAYMIGSESSKGV